MCESFTNYRYFTEDTKYSLPVFKISEQVLLLIHILYMLLLLQVNNFFCDLNFLHENLILILFYVLLKFRDDLFSGVYFHNFFTVAKNMKLKTCEFKYQ